MNDVCRLTEKLEAARESSQRSHMEVVDLRAKCERLEASNKATVHTLIMIAERCEELTADLASGFDANELLDAMIETGKRARAALADTQEKKR